MTKTRKSTTQKYVGILFVNGKRRGVRVQGSAVIPRGKYRRAAKLGEQRGPRARPASIKHGIPKRAKYTGARKFGLERLVQLQRAAGAGMRTPRTRVKRRKSAPRGRQPKTVRMRRYSASSIAAAAQAAYIKRGRPRRSKSMAKRKSSKRRRAMLKVWRARRKAGKMGGIGRTRRAAPKRRKRRARRGKVAAVKRGRRRARRGKSTKRSRAMRRVWARRRKAGKMGAIGRTRRVRGRRRRASGKRRRARKVAAAPKRRRRRPRSFHVPGVSRAIVPWARPNPRRRRRRRNGGGHRRYTRRYRRNPGMSDLMSVVKGAIPVLASLYGTRAVVGLAAMHLPGVSSLGALAHPVLSIASIFGASFLAGKVAFLGRHKQGIMIGAGLAALDSLVRSFAPAAVKAMIPGMGDYVQMGDYIAVGATPLDDNMTLSDYIAVGGDGIEEELGLEEELGVDEELGDATLGGVMGSGGKLLAPVPNRSFLKPIPARSFTKVIPPAGTNYDNPGQLYNGIFGGGFGR